MPRQRLYIQGDVLDTVSFYNVFQMGYGNTFKPDFSGRSY